MSEHGLKEDDIKTVILQNYFIPVWYCRDKRKAGGVAIVCNKSLSYDIVDVKSIEMVFECVCIKLLLQSFNIYIISLYRSPDASLLSLFLEHFENLLKNITFKLKRNDILLVGGDFNIDIFVNSKDTRLYKDIIASFGLKIINHQATRVTNISSTLIDHLIISENYHTQFCEASDVSFSDHRATTLYFVSREITPNNNDIIYRRSFSLSNYKTMFRSLYTESWEGLFEAQSANEKWSIFLGIFKYHFDNIFPKLKIKCRNNKTKPKWLNNQIIKKGEELKDLNNIIKKFDNENVNTEHLKLKYRNKFKQYKRSINIEKRKHNDDILKNAKNKTRACWNIIKKSCNPSGNKVTKLKNLVINGKIVNDGLEMANKFNEYFVNATNEMISVNLPSFSSNNFDEYTPYTSSQKFGFKPISVQSILSIIKNLQNRNIAGPDEVPHTLIKFIDKLIVIPLTHVINTSLEQGVFPDELKVASVVPLHKKGAQDQVENYRSIAKQSVFAKILELGIRPQIQNYRKTEGFTSPSQHGFTAKKSINTGLFNFLKPLYLDLDLKRHCVVVSFDIRKAFDSVDKRVLLNEIRIMNAEPEVLNFFNSYLSGRSQVVDLSLENHVTSQSNKLPTYFGLQQGSCLSPELYDILTYDLQNHLSCARAMQYADDINMSVSADTPEELQLRLNLTLIEVEQWCVKKRLVLHPEKSSLMYLSRYGKSDSNINGNIFNHKIKQVSSVRILGVIIQDDLTWDNHIDQTRKKLNSANFALLSIRNSISLSNLLSVYYAYVYSNLSFGILFWGSNDVLIHSMFIIQKRSLRIMNNFTAGTSCRTHFRRLGLLTVPCIYIFISCLYKKQYAEEFIHNSDYHDYNTRNRHNVALPLHSSNFIAKSPYYRSASLYDHLPRVLRNVTNQNLFRNLLKKLLVDKEYYDVKNYMEDVLTESDIFKYISKKDLLKFS